MSDVTMAVNYYVICKSSFILEVEVLFTTYS